VNFIYHDYRVVQGPYTVRHGTNHGLEFSRSNTVIIKELDTILYCHFQLLLDFLSFFGSQSIVVGWAVKGRNPYLIELGATTGATSKVALRDTIDVMGEEF
jgi:hypothetical protein